LLAVFENEINGSYELVDHCDWNTEESGELKVIYRNGHFKNRTTLSEIRNRLK